MSGAAPSPARDEAVREHAREILAREPYARWERSEGPLRQALDALGAAVEGALRKLFELLPEPLRAVLDAIAAFVEGLFGGGPRAGLEAPGPLAWVLGGAITAGLVALFVLGLRRASLRGGVGAAAADRPARRAPAGPARAEALARAGHTLEAAHLLQLHALALLLERRWLQLARSDPNRTLRRRLEASRLPDRERRQLVELVDRLERHWFRDRRDDPDLFEAWRRLCDRLEALGQAP